LGETNQPKKGKAVGKQGTRAARVGLVFNCGLRKRGIVKKKKNTKKNLERIVGALGKRKTTWKKREKPHSEERGAVSIRWRGGG